MESVYLKFLKRYVLKDKGLFALVSIITVIQSLVSLGIPLTYTLLIDKALPDKSIRQFFIGISCMLGCYVLNSLFNVVKDYFQARMAENLSGRLRIELNEKISVLEYRFFDRHNLSEVLSRYNMEIETIKDSCGYMLIKIFSNAVTLVSTCIMMFLLDWKILLASLAILVLYLFSSKYWGVKVRELAEKSMECNQASIDCITDNYNNALIAKLYNAYHYANKRFREIYQKQYDNAVKLELTYSLSLNSSALLIYLLTGIVWCMGGYAVFNGSMTVGVVIALTSYNASLLAPAGFFSEFNNSLQGTRTAMERLLFILDYQEEEGGSEITAGALESIRLERVQFGYQEGTPVLNDGNAVLNKGQITAFMGASGCGKSTITKLLLGLYQPQKGDIYFGDCKMRNIDLGCLRKKIGYIAQDSLFYHDSIEENLKLSGNTDRNQIEQACRRLDLYDEIMGMPDKWNSSLAHGAGNLSGGQKKRLDIVRALLKECEVLIFDECTASIDAKRRELLFEILDEIKKDKIIVFISHNQEETVHYDRIYEMRHGRLQMRDLNRKEVATA